METKNEAGYKVGDILSSTWGYSMQIVDYYQVIAVTPKMITVKQIAGKILDGDGMRGTSVPLPNVFIKKAYDWDVTEFKRKVLSGGYININDSACARPWDGKPVYYDHWD